jgi:cytochrome c5
MNTCNARPLVTAALIALVPALAWGMGAKPKQDNDIEAANMRILPVAKVKLAPPAASGTAAGSRSGEDLYKAVCGACHEAGVAGAPKFGDKAAWAPRIGVGLDMLTKTVIAGKGAMPPKGGSDATPEEIARAVVFMANKAGANFK